MNSPTDPHPLAGYESAAAVAVEVMCQKVGYGRMQQLIGELWDKAHNCAPRGRMGMTVDDRLPPLPKPKHLKRQQRGDGGYNMVPAYTESEMRAYAHAAVIKAQQAPTGGAE